MSGHLTNASRCAQITDAGTIDNTMLVSVFDGYGTNVSGNYQISYEYGTLTVTPRPITVKADDAEKVYDGTPLTCGTVSVVSEYKLVAGHILTAATEGSQTDVGESTNRVTEGSVKIVDGDGTDALRNYAVSLAEGTLTVTPRAITVKADDAEKVYDGTPLTCETVSVVSEYKLVAGHILTAETEGSRTEVGVGANRVTEGSVKIADGNGADVTKNYSVNYQDGTLTVLYPGTLAIRTHGAQKVYDGTPLAYNADDYYVTGLPQGWRIQFSLSGISLTEAGVLDLKTLEALPVSVYDENGTKLTEESDYVVVFEGTDVMAIGKRAITIVSESDMKEYDGTPLENGGYRIASGSLVQGHTLEVEIIGSIIDIGTAYNNFGSIRILDADGNDVTDNYEIQTVRGILEVISD